MGYRYWRRIGQRVMGGLPGTGLFLTQELKNAGAPQRGSDTVVVLIWLVALIIIAVVFAMGMR
jgi:hypothetical protein